MRVRWRRVALWVAGVAVAIQLVPVWLWQKNPAVVREPAWDGPRTRQLARGACYDCHSDETVWPLYARIAPSSWLVTYDVLAGRGEMNFSEWGVRPGEGKSVTEIVKAVRDGDMPPWPYRSAHAPARLDAAATAELIRGVERSLGGGTPTEGEGAGQ